jgi:hypothetical protein
MSTSVKSVFGNALEKKDANFLFTIDIKRHLL